jgi:tetratricopeptide (TPR) repeat protein/transcriptional regulator with XRE-family HTH domain
VTERQKTSFAVLLRQLRVQAQLTQEELAERAKLSPRSISDLERGVHNTPRRDTTQLLALALGLTGLAKEEFEAVARGSAGPAGDREPVPPAVGVAAATRTLPRDVSSFTGREAELRQLVETVAGHAQAGWLASIYAIGGMAGIGKTAFAVHAAHQLAPRFPDGQIFLPLHGHTPGHQPVAATDALASLLQTAGMAAQQIPSGLEPRTRIWRDYLAGKRMLLLFDDAAGQEQIRPLLPGTAGSLVLVTSRRHLTALEDAQAISLDILKPDAAISFLIRVAGRPELSAGDAAVADIARLCGYLPLAVGMLGRQLHHHPAWTAAKLAAELADAQDRRLDMMRTEDLSVAAALDLSYQDLTDSQQLLFRRLGLHPGVEIDAYAAAALGCHPLAEARTLLAALYDHYLLTELTWGRYRFHDLVGEHARALVARDSLADNDAAIGRLTDYYLCTATAADRYLVRRTPAGRAAIPGSAPAAVPAIADRASAVTWMDVERFNLQAVVGHAAGHRRPRHAISIATAMHGFLRSQGYWDQALILYRAVLGVARQAGDELAQAGALTDLGDMQTLSGEYRAAVGSHEQALRLYRGHGDRLGEANALDKLATVQQALGDCQLAAGNLVAALTLHRDLGDRLGEANDLNQLGVVQYQTEEYRLAAASHQEALALRRVLGDRLGEAIALWRLGCVQQATEDYQAATASLTRALELHREAGYRFGEATVLGQLGAVLQVTGDHRAAAATQERALELYRALGYPRGEAEALGELGLVKEATGRPGAALVDFLRALDLHRGTGSRLGEAQVLNHLGGWYLTASCAAEALDPFTEALAIAKGVASRREEARALEGLGRCQAANGRREEAVALLRASAAIYQAIESIQAEQVMAALKELEA